MDQTQGLPALGQGLTPTGATDTQPQRLPPAAGMPPLGVAAIEPRPANLIPVPAGDLSVVSDTTLVAKSFSFAAAP